MTSTSKCPKCGKSVFELSTETIKGAEYPYCFIRCADCKTVVGVVEYTNNAQLIRNLAKALNVSAG